MLNAIAKPFGMLMLWLYEFLNNYGLAVILFALIVKLILLPFMMKSKRGTMRTQSLQPVLKELEKRHGANKQKYNEEVQKLYREEKINPMGGCLWSLIPFPILLALYQAIRFPLTIMMRVPQEHVDKGGALYELLQSNGYQEWFSGRFTAQMEAGYGQIAMSQFITEKWDTLQADFVAISDRIRTLDYGFLGLDLGAVPQWKIWQFDFSGPAETWLPKVGLFLIPVIAAALTLWQSIITQKMNPQPESTDPSQQGTQASMKTMTYMMPLMTLFFAFAMPAALGLYWIASTGFSMIQDIVLTKHYQKVMKKESAERDARMKKKMDEIARKHAETERLRAENQTEVNPNTSREKQQKQAKLLKEQKAAEYERRMNPSEEVVEPSRVGERRYARGRAYDPDRFAAKAENAEAAAEEAAESEATGQEE